VQQIRNIIKEILSEAAGVPGPILPYSDVIKTAVFNKLKIGEINTGVFIGAQKLRELGFSETGIYKNEYLKFPLRAIQINFRTQKFPDLNSNYDVHGQYLSNSSKIENLTISNKELKTWNVKLDCIVGINEKIESINFNELEYNLEAFLNHELTHAYELYNKTIANKVTTHDTSSLLDYARIKSNDNTNNLWNKFLYAVYFTLQYEINARIPEVYAHIKAMKEKGMSNAEIIEALPKEHAWNFATQLENFNHMNFLQKLENSFQGTEQDPHEYLERKISSFQNDLLNLTKDTSLITGQKNKFLEKMSKVDPIEFLQKWKKIFNERGNYMKRKIAKLLTYEPINK